MVAPPSAPPFMASVHVWPPPGTSALRGELGPLGNLVSGANLLFAAGVVLLVVPTFSGWAEDPTLALGGVLAGSMFYLLAIFKAWSLLREARALAAAGLPPVVLLWVAADFNGKLSPIIRGEDAHASLDVAERELLLSHWVTTVLAGIGVQLLTPLMTVLALLLAVAGAVGPLGFLLVMFSPLVLLFLNVRRGLRAGWLHWRAQRSAPPPDATAIAAWAEASGVGTARSGASGWKWVNGRRAQLTAGAISLAILASAGFLLTITLGGQFLMEASTPRYGGVADRLASAAELRGLRLPPNPEISPRQAGEALHALSWAGRDPDPDFLRPVRELPALEVGPAYNSLGLGGERWIDDLIARATVGFEPESREALQELARHPALDELRTLAGARRGDLVATRFAPGALEGLAPIEIPFPRLSNVRETSRLSAASAAIHLEAGRPDAAELELRTLASAGYFLMDEGTSLIEALVGVVLVRDAAQGLAALYRIGGRGEEAGRISRILEHRESFQSDDLLERALASGSRGYTWEALSYTAYETCLTPSGFLFGSDPVTRSRLETAHLLLARDTAEEELFWTSLGGRNGRGMGQPGCARLLLGS